MFYRGAFKKVLTKLLFGTLFLSLFLVADTRESTDPYTYILSARSIAMGRTAVASSEDSFSLFSNPASIAKTDKFQLGLTTFQLFEEYTFLGLSTVFKLKIGHIGLSYAAVGMGDIPETSIEEEGSEFRIKKIDSYSSKDEVFGVTYALPLGDRFGLTDLDFGVNFKVANSQLADEVLTGWGFDTGIKFSLPGRLFEGMRFGAAVQNIWPPVFSKKAAIGTSEDDSDDDESEVSDSAYAMNLRLGAAKNFNIKIPFTKIVIKNLLLAADYDNTGIHLGGEYVIDRSLYIRAGLDDFKMTMGLGLKIFSFTGFDYQPYTVAFDYAYHLYDEPLENMHFISFSVLGVTKTQTPAIALPMSSTRITSDRITVQGSAQAGSDISLYVNSKLRKTFKAETAGVWTADNVYLDQGRNEIYVMAQYPGYVVSGVSNYTVVYSDNLIPKIKTDIYREGSVLYLNVTANKAVKAVAVSLPDDKKLLLKYNEADALWQGQWLIPLEYIDSYLHIKTIAIDENDTKSEIIEDIISTKLIAYPKDKSVVYGSDLVIRGKVAPEIKAIKLGTQTLEPDAEGNYALPVTLANMGKNTLELVAVDESGKEIKTAIRILRLDTANDLADLSWARKDIIDNVSLGIFEKKGEAFFPKDYVTRGEFAAALSKVRGLPVEKNIARSPAADVSPATTYANYIKAVIDAGYLENDRENKFNPDQYIYKKDAVMAVVLMEGIDVANVKITIPFKDVPAGVAYRPYVAAALSAGMIPSSESFYPNNRLDRATAAVLLARSKYFKQKTETMYNWKKGYGEQFYEEDASQGTDEIYVEGKVLSFTDENQQLRIVEPKDMEVIYKETVQIKGIAKGKSVTINNVPVVVNAKGYFTAEVGLLMGKNIIVIESAETKEQLRLLRMNAFSDLNENEAEIGKHLFAMYQVFEGGRLDQSKELTRRELVMTIAKLQRVEPYPIAEPEAVVLWPEALQLVNIYAGLAETDKTLIKDNPLYQEDKAITRGAFLELLNKTEKIRTIIKNLKDSQTYNNEKYKPDKVRSRTISVEESSIKSDERVAFDLYSGNNTAQAQGFANATADDLFTGGAAGVTRTGESIISGGSGALKIFAPQNNFITVENKINISGMSSAEDLKVDGRTVPLDKQGRFTDTAALALGKNTIKISSSADQIYLKGVRLKTYADIVNLSEKRAIEYLATLGYFGDSTNFEPQKEVSREEFASLLVRLSGKKPPQVFTDPYQDVPANSAAAASITFLKQNNLFANISGKFEPKKIIDQQEAHAWFKKVSRAVVEAGNGELSRLEVVRWFAKDSRLQDQVKELRS